jgi:hypothetical protein
MYAPSPAKKVSALTSGLVMNVNVRVVTGILGYARMVIEVTTP